MTGAHWAAAYVGVPWVAGEADCWHFAARIWQERFGIDVPVVEGVAADARLARRLIESGAERAMWTPVATAREGDGVLMARGSRPCHVGVWVEPDRVLHSVRGAGGLCTPAGRLGEMGYRIVGQYRRTA